MKHHKKGRQLKRGKHQNRALLQGLASSLIKHGKIKTSEARARELRPYVEKLITRARTNTLASRRLLISRLGNEVVVRELMTNVAPLYQNRPGGYTRIVKMGPRKGDGAKMAFIELVGK